MNKLLETRISIKQLISYVFGISALLITVGEIQDWRFWWMKPLAILVLIAIGKWNGVFDENLNENY